MCKIIIIFYLHIYVHKVNNGRLGSRLLTSAFKSWISPPQLELDLLSFVLKKGIPNVSIIKSTSKLFIQSTFYSWMCRDLIQSQRRAQTGVVCCYTLQHYHIAVHLVSPYSTQLIQDGLKPSWKQSYLQFKSQAIPYNTSKPINTYQYISKHEPWEYNTLKQTISTTSLTD